MGRMGIAVVIAIFVQGAYSAPAESLEKVGWWTLARSMDPATGKQDCVARHVGGAMTLRHGSLTIAGAPMQSVPSDGVLKIAFDDVPFPAPLDDAAGITRNFGVLTLEGAAFAKAVVSNKLMISVGTVDATQDMRGSKRALQWIKNACEL